MFGSQSTRKSGAVEISIIEFLKKDHNFLLAAVAVVSGAMLLWPFVRLRAGGARVSAAEATTLINREDALVIDAGGTREFSPGQAPGAKKAPLARTDDGANAP